MPQSAQVLIPFSWVHLRIPHHDAFSFNLHPGHFSCRYLRHAPQYNPHLAISRVSEVICFIVYLVMPIVQVGRSYNAEARTTNATF